MKIVFLSRYINKVSRGAETYVLELAKRLGENHVVEVLAGKDADSFFKMAGTADIVIPTNGRLQALKASFSRSLGKSKLVISGQAGIGRDDLWNIVVVRPDVYVALTEAEKVWAERWAWGTKVVKIPNGVDLKRFNPNGLKEDLRLKGKVVLSVGALFWYKHHELAIRAVSETDNSLLIIGNGPEKKRLMKLGLGLLGKKRFKILEVGYGEIDKFYRSADLFTLPSWNKEAFGIVYLEAMACNIPVVAPDDLSRREIIGSGGVLVDVGSIVKYKEAINWAMLKDWGNLPREQAERFSWDMVAEQYLKLFEQLNQ